MTRITNTQYKILIQKKKGSKYLNKKSPYKNRMYDSIKEKEYAMFLDSELRAKRVIAVEEQVRFNFVFNKVKICTYVLDFKVTYPDHSIEYIDVKPFDKKTGKFRTTDVFRMKKKLMKAFYDIDVKLV